MTSDATLERFRELKSEAYHPSVGAWVQVVPGAGLTTVLHAFNALGPQDHELFLIDPAGEVAAQWRSEDHGPMETRRIDLAEHTPASEAFEGTLWVWSRSQDDTGAIGTAAMSLDFVDRARPEGHSDGSVHVIYDFFDTLDRPPYLDLISPNVVVERTPEGSDRFLNYLGLAHLLVSDEDFDDPATVELELTMSPAVGETWVSAPVQLPPLGSWFMSLEVVFPGLADFLADSDGRGGGVVGVRDPSGRTTGVASMLKVVDVVHGSMSVNHLIDRYFSRVSLGKG
jgi:hypothetical protein